jgi:hypothetical protein
MASALLNVARGPHPVGVLSFLPRQESVKDRIIAVLTQERTGRSVARLLLRGGAAVVALALVATATLADPLHHALETLFGLI